MRTLAQIIQTLGRRTVPALLMGAIALSASAASPALKVYLPRQMEIKDDKAMTLGQICMVRCDDADLAKKAAQVAMGRAPWSREDLKIDRTTILSRLAATGINAQNVEITGAQTVTLHRDERTIAADELSKAAEDFLRNNPPKDGATWSADRRPEALAVKAQGDLTLQARLGKAPTAGHLVVEVAAMAGQKELARREVLFKLQYTVHQAVVTKPIAAGDPITPDNTELRPLPADRPAQDAAVPFGHVAAAPMGLGAVIRPNMLRDAKPILAVKKDQSVLMKIVGDSFAITAVGVALQEGRVGDFIKVQNVDSKRVVLVKVTADGTVEPVTRSPIAAVVAAQSASKQEDK